MKEVVRSHLWWETIDRDIETLVRQCASCQQTRPVPTAVLLMPWTWPGKPWHRVHADFATKEEQDLLVMVDAHSKWPEILPMLSTTAVATIAIFRDVFARFGFLVNVVTDNGHHQNLKLPLEGVVTVPVIPGVLQEEAVHVAHANTSHALWETMYDLLCNECYFPDMAATCQAHVQQCVRCASASAR